MKPLAKTIENCVGSARQIACVALIASLCLFDTSVSWAAKKKAEAEAAPTKSYVVPYMIVLVLLGGGLMAVCRPSGRHDKMDDMNKKDEEE